MLPRDFIDFLGIEHCLINVLPGHLIKSLGLTYNELFTEESTWQNIFRQFT